MSIRPVRASRVALVATLLLSTLPASVALAGGLEYAGGTGARSLARGGAVHAKADNPLVLRYNPAGLAELRGGMLNGSLNLALMDACFDAYGFYGWGFYTVTPGGLALPGPDGEIDTRIEVRPQDPTVKGLTDPDDPSSYVFLSEPLPEVCLEQSVAPIPNGAASYRVTEDLGVGFGMIFPSAMPGGRWGDQDGLVRNEDGELRPSPARNMIVSNGTIGIFPTVGAGYRIMDWLRVGVALQWGIVWADVSTNSSTSGGTDPGNDIATRIIGKDLFVPGVTSSIHAVPIDAVDVVLAFRWQDNVSMKNPSAFVTTGSLHENATEVANQQLNFHEIFQPMPWALTLGARYADRLLPRPTGTGHGEAGRGEIRDAMSDERWDIEFDAQYQFNSRVDQSSAFPINTCDQSVPDSCQQIVLQKAQPGAVPEELAFPSAKSEQGIFVQRQWEDQWSLRLGGSYNILPGVVSLHAGAHYETRGIDLAYMTPEAWPLQRIGLHTGVTYRWRSLDFTLAYGHIFQETVIVGSPPHGDAYERDVSEDGYANGERVIDKRVGYRTEPGEVLGAVEDPSEPKNSDATAAWEQNTSSYDRDKPAYVVNSGKYTSSLELFAIAITAHF